MIKEFCKELNGSVDIAAVAEATLANRIACEVALFFDRLDVENLIQTAKELSYD